MRQETLHQDFHPALAISTLDATTKTLSRMIDVQPEQLAEAANYMTNTANKGGRFILIGNGGSAAVAEQYGAGLPKWLTEGIENVDGPQSMGMYNPSTITMVGNDDGYENTFYNQMLLLDLNGNDSVIAFSGSGTSPNIVKAVKYAREKGANVIGMTFGDKGLAEEANVILTIPGDDLRALIPEEEATSQKDIQGPHMGEYEAIASALMFSLTKQTRQNLIKPPETDASLDLKLSIAIPTLIAIKNTIEEMLKNEKFIRALAHITQLYMNAYSSGGRVMFVGDESSSALSNHYGADAGKRPTVEIEGAKPSKAFSLTDSIPAMTMRLNNGAREIYSDRFRTYKPGDNDIIFIYSANGNSPQILNVVDEAKRHGTKVLGFTSGETGLINKADIVIKNPGKEKGLLADPENGVYIDFWMHALLEEFRRRVKKSSKSG
ncbi:MAG: phosphoheptose isomerase, D-sedoheptulose 7-phosphate isomerase [Candidatus Gottesmanbacteria bacterium GW2011_GWA2_43_14]|uniref:Phosphoheptose isomerase, D-sedoheptulose 7-phosphate isomerase n=1 Tax=Candidatus Gottesmanbacteria bacterium GW2011_GWA2_43_14 TaxID=1618443 RepID=A0A0G1DJ79_9BACT|nr:MAG: phosphoheptose isomerase, D-sedoheptulose 7-phosphate isomerase [Candidatus Gottesmanbacteria bacterium GW2011_GWA2_43_14]